MSFPKYPKYKDSGIEWLGQVPEHWHVSSLKRGYDVTLGKMLQPESKSPDDELLPYLRAANIKWEGIDTGDIKKMWLSKRDQSQLRLSDGDLLVSEGGDVGRSCLWTGELGECYFQNSVNRIRAHSSYSNSYLRYWMSTVKDKGYIDVLCNKSTIAHFTAEKVAAVPVPYPTPSEQIAIAAFLDRETAKIDELVAEQRRLMELLKEKRQAVISHAVTKGLSSVASAKEGLNPDLSAVASAKEGVPMKPSGIEWLGDVPEHWEVGNLKRYWGVTDCKHVTAEFVDEGFPLASIREVQSRWVKLEDAKRTTEHFYELLIEGGRQPLPGDLIFSRNATVGEVAQVPEEHPRFAMGQDVVLLRKLSPKYSSDFLQHVIRSPIIIQQLAHMMIGSTFKRINVEEIRSFVIPSPPAEEQKEVADYLEVETTKFDTLTAEAQHAIDLLQERRTALISAAVTGQIDVREEVAS